MKIIKYINLISDFLLLKDLNFCFMDEVKKRSLDVAVKNSRPFGSHRRKELGKVSTKGDLGTLPPGGYLEFTGGTHPC